MSFFQGLLGGGPKSNSGYFTTNSGSEYLVSSATSLLNNEIKGTGQKFSITIWLKRTVVDGTYQTIFSRDNNSGGRQFACEFTPNEEWTFFIADDASNYSWWKTGIDSTHGAPFTNTNCWYHMVMTFDNTQALANKCKIYINGILENTYRVDLGAGVSNVNNQPSEPIYINVTNFGGLINPFKGDLGEINFYTDILTQNDVTALFSDGQYRNARDVPTSISPYMNWTPYSATFSTNWTMGDNMNTSYGVSKNFVSNALVFGDRSLNNPTTNTFAATSLNIIAAMTTTPSLRDKYIIDATYQNISNDGDWSNILDIGFLSAHDQQASRLKWKALTEIVETGSPVWTQNIGYTGASGKYLRTGINLSSDGGSIYTLNSGCLGTYLLDNLNEATASIGALSGSNAALIVPRNSGSIAARINSATNSTVASSDSRGLHTARRTASNAQALYKNGSSVVSNSSVSNGLPNAEVYVMAYNNGGTDSLHSTNRFACWFIASGAISQTNINLRIKQYMQSKGCSI